MKSNKDESINRNNTCFIFDEKKIIISPDLKQIFYFLEDIDKEIKTLLALENRIESIRKQYIETFKLIEVMAKKLKENSIDFEFTLSEHPATINDKLYMDQPVRSKFIVLFAYLEVFFCLNIAYENKIWDKKEIIKKTMDSESIESFLNIFCLNEENEWVKKNKKRKAKIRDKDLRDLRNALTHFFSIGSKLQIVSRFDKKTEKLEKILGFKAIYISARDLYEIIKGAGILIMKKWSNDCLNRKNNDFKERILSVEAIVESYGAVIVRGDKINL